ncbi:TPA: DUF2514 family protein [Escherichia coli]|nr:DUF2514 family protein [Escherichia coli]
MFALLKTFWKPLALIALVASLLWGFSHWRYTAGYEAADLAWSKKWADRNAADAKAKAAEESRQRNIEQQRQAAVIEEGKRVDEELAKNQANAAAAERTAGELQQQLKQLRKQYAASETRRLSTAAAVGQAKAEAVMVLTDVLGKSVERNQQLAKTADDNYTSSGSCERAYDKVTGQ